MLDLGIAPQILYSGHEALCPRVEDVGEDRLAAGNAESFRVFPFLLGEAGTFGKCD